MHPILILSTSAPQNSLTIFNAASSSKKLGSSLALSPSVPAPKRIRSQSAWATVRAPPRTVLAPIARGDRICRGSSAVRAARKIERVLDSITHRVRRCYADSAAWKTLGWARMGLDAERWTERCVRAASRRVDARGCERREDLRHVAIHCQAWIQRETCEESNSPKKRRVANAWRLISGRARRLVIERHQGTSAGCVGAASPRALPARSRSRLPGRATTSRRSRDRSMTRWGYGTPLDGGSWGWAWAPTSPHGCSAPACRRRAATLPLQRRLPSRSVGGLSGGKGRSDALNATIAHACRVARAARVHVAVPARGTVCVRFRRWLHGRGGLPHRGRQVDLH